ncbi:MAG: glycoside hydrolase family 15 protein [Gammaproteobacteria bacterium]|nr:glycoside hydrolase family 15 protein [Gammaproteobacteria bacterium]
MSAQAADGLDLALIGNGQIAALVDRTGCIVWACLPRPDGDPVFCALLKREGAGADAGLCAVDLRSMVAARSQYLANTAILETVLTDADGNAVRITDFCPRFRRRGRVFRPMSIVRLIEPIAGRPVITIRLRPLANYGAETPRHVTGSHHVRFNAPPVAYRVTTNGSLASLLDATPFVLDGPVAMLLTPDESLEHAPLSLARDWLEETREYWHEWVRGLAIPFDWQDAVIRAAVTLKLCTYEDTGAVLAAITTSIPEVEASGRNWDYRFCWLRDSFFVIHALNRLGATNTMEGYLRYLDRVVVRSPEGALQPLYGIGGEVRIEERVLGSLDGYLGMGPVRVGNLAYEQIQHDVYGAVVLAARQLFFDRRLTRLGDAALFSRLEVLGERAVACFAQPDAGPWEFRGEAAVHTFSAVMCWAACDRLSRIAAQLALEERASFWRHRAEAMRAEILRRAWSEARGSFVGRFEGRDLDATVLLLPDLGFIEAMDPRFLSTLAAVEHDLVRGDLVFRYRHADDFGVPANTFTMCSFWYVNALAGAGRADEARALFERLLSRRNGAGLFSEDIDPTTGRQWGNFPQTYSMVGVILSALRLSRSWEEML